MQTVIWIAAGILAVILGFWLVRLAVRRWPQQRIVLMVALALALMIEIFVLDIEPPQEISTVRANAEALSFPIATLFWMLHGLLFGGVIATADTRHLAERERARARSG